MLTVQSKSDRPFGIFHNSFKDEFIMENITWETISDYVLHEYGGKNLQEPLSINMDVLWLELEKTIVNSAFQAAITAKASIDPNFEGLLLSADSKSILYISENKFFGTDLSGNNGENIYGKWLTNYKNQISEENPQVFYNFYVLNKLLKKAIELEPLDHYLNLARNGYGSQALIRVLNEKYGNIVEIPTRELIETIRVEDNVKAFLIKPEEIILNVIQAKIREVRKRNLEAFKIQILHQYLEKTINNMGVKYDIQTFFTQIEPAEREQMLETVYEQYMLEETKKIHPNLYIPSQEDVEKYESLDLQGFTNPLPYKDHYAFVDETTSRLSMADDKYILDIEGKQYPTIHHYIIYKIAHLIKDPKFDPYSLVLDKTTGLFIPLHISQKSLSEYLMQFKNHYFSGRIVNAIYEKVNTKPYIADYIKASRPRIKVADDIIPHVSSKVYTELFHKIPWGDVMHTRGSVLDYIDTDPFFIHLQTEFLESFLSVVVISTPGNFTYENIKKTYDNFWGKITGTVKNLTIKNYDGDVSLFQEIGRKFNIILDENSCKFLKSNFVSRIVAAEDLSRDIFKSNIIYLTKFMIIESQYRMFSGAFIDYTRDYTDFFSIELLAMVNVINFIANCNGYKILQKEHILRAYKILTTSKLDARIIYPNYKDKINIKKSIHENHELPLDLLSVTKKIDENKRKKIIVKETENNEYNPEDNVEFLEPEVIDNLDEEMVLEYYGDELEDGNLDEEYYGELMFGSKNLTAEVIIAGILKSLQTSRENYKLLIDKTRELQNSKHKNMYRIHLWN